MKPVKTVMPYALLKDRVSAGGYLIQRKFDGQFTPLELQAGDDLLLLLTELVTRKSGLCSTPWDMEMLSHYKGFYVLLTLAGINGQNLLDEPNAWRYETLVSMKDRLINYSGLPLVYLTQYAALPSELPGEGLVAHPADSPWGHMLCAKNRQDYIVEVLKTSARRSVLVIETEQSRSARGGHLLGTGNVPVYARAAEMILPGTLLKITALGLTASGQFREPQLDTDTPDSWLVKP